MSASAGSKGLPALEEETYRRASLDFLSATLTTPGGAAWWSEFRSSDTGRMTSVVDPHLRSGDFPGFLEMSFWRNDEPKLPNKSLQQSNHGEAQFSRVQSGDEPGVSDRPRRRRGLQLKIDPLGGGS